jgi:hypothetical protein
MGGTEMQKSTREFLARIALAGCAVAALSACSAPAVEHEVKQAAPSVTASQPADGLGSTSPTTETDGTDDYAVVKEKTVEKASFLSPTKNIGCYLDATIAHCDVRDRNWTLPPRPKSCDPARGTDWGDGVEVRNQQKGSVACTSDSALGPNHPVLAYGQALRAGSMWCVSARAGMRCTNSSTGHGFTAAQAIYTVF